MTSDTTRYYNGWEISFSISTSESDYGQEPFAPEFDFDASILELEHIQLVAVQDAFPGAIVETHWDEPGFSSKTRAYGPPGTSHDDEERVIETVNAICEHHFSDMPAWLVPNAVQN